MAKKKVVIVDDEAALTDLYARYLEDDYTVVRAYDGLEAMDLIDGTTDLVTLDLRMAGVTGIHVYQWIREQGYDCPVIVVSAINPHEADLAWDPDNYLVKPVSHEELLAAIRQFI